MNNEYIIVNKTTLQKRIEELKERQKEFLSNHPDDVSNYDSLGNDIEILEQIISQSTPLIPEIEKAIEFGKDIRREKSFINNNYGSAFVDYEDSTEETNNYISSLKLDI